MRKYVALLPEYAHKYTTLCTNLSGNPGTLIGFKHKSAYETGYGDLTIEKAKVLREPCKR